jgi:O-antigen/teichoic acid export membrane protein
MIVNLIANIVLIPKYGIEGAATATLLANGVLVAIVISLFFMKKLLSRTQTSEVTNV